MSYQSIQYCDNIMIIGHCSIQVNRETDVGGVEGAKHHSGKINVFSDRQRRSIKPHTRSSINVFSVADSVEALIKHDSKQHCLQQFQYV